LRVRISTYAWAGLAVKSVACGRGLAEKQGDELKLVLDDFPFAEDGLLIWNALESYFTTYLSMFYSDDGHGGKPKVCSVARSLIP
jgi:hypothetical protein